MIISRRNLSYRLAQAAAFLIFALVFSSTAQALELETTSSADPVQEGTALTVTMTVSNPSASPLANVVLQAVTPDYMSFTIANTSPTAI
ncbi:MAG: hypothetical protein ACYTHJ_21655 [Planctomycetota bacterium]|jgi:uncharacterized protein (DUF58 family)